MFEFILACTISLKQRRLQKTLFHRFLCRSVGVSDVLVAREYLSLDSRAHAAVIGIHDVPLRRT